MKRRKTVDWELIMSFDPCPDWYEDRVRGAVPKRISLVRFLLNTSIPPADRLWVALHGEFMPDALVDSAWSVSYATDHLDELECQCALLSELLESYWRESATQKNS